MWGLGVDVELLGVLLLLVGLDGLKRVEADTVIFRQVLFGSWRPGEPTDSARWLIPSPFTPLVMTATVPAATAGASSGTPDARGRYQAAGGAIRVLRVLGGAQLVALLAGVPFGVARWSGLGLLVALALTFVLDAIISAVTARQWRRLPVATRLGARRVLSWLSPFSAAAAAQDLLQESLRGATAPEVAHLLLPANVFRRWVRPLAYDVLHGAASSSLGGLFSESELGAIVAEAPAVEADSLSYCARCGRTFRQAAGTCSSCGVTLRAISHPAGSQAAAGAG